MIKLLENYSGIYPEAGCDEAGRGCLAGPVCAAAVILPNNFSHPLINDSKQLTETNRLALRSIIESNAVSYSVAFVSEAEIDKINILNASILAMHKALNGLTIAPKFIVIDGNRFKPYKNVTYATIVKGDSKMQSIAAASILAKTYRDEFMEKLHQKYPMYKWNQNKGYPTVAHRLAIKKYGSTIYHRKSFTLLPPQLKLSL